LDIVINAVLRIVQLSLGIASLPGQTASLTDVAPAAFGGRFASLSSLGARIVNGKPTFFLRSFRDDPDIAPGAFGAVAANDRMAICKAQTVISRHPDFMNAKLLASSILADGLQLPRELISAVLSEDDFCADVLPERVSQYDAPPAKPRPDMLAHFLVDENNIPVSSDPVWNSCIRGEHILNRLGRPVNCHRDNFSNRHGTWYHPDFPNVSFYFVLRDPRGHTYPENFVLHTTTETDPDLLVAQAKETNTLVAVLQEELDVILAEAGATE